jgi:hypothetical protein
MRKPGPLTADDRWAISDLLLRIGRCLDQKDAVGYAATFAPDGLRRIVGFGGDATAVGAGQPSQPLRDEYVLPREQRGRAAIQAAIQSSMDSWAMPIRHFTTEAIVEGNAERCQAMSYCQVIVELPSGPCAIEQVAQYEDMCVKIDGQWLFAERLIRGLLDGHDTLQRKPRSSA